MSGGIGPDHELRSFAVPVQPRPFRLVVGVRPSDRWLLPGSDGPTQIQTKRQLLVSRAAEVLIVRPGAEHAVAQLAQMVFDEVAGRAPTAGAADGPGIPVLDDSPSGAGTRALAQAAMAVQEDFCVLQRDPAGDWRLTAGCVCFPSHWRLSDKIGHDLDAIHAPVPDYAYRLADASRAVFDRVARDRGSAVWERFNWTITADDDLYHPEPVPEVPVAVDQVPQRLWLRTERQSLRALAGHGGVVFGIRTFLTGMGELTSHERTALAASLPGVSPELARYRSALGYRDAVQKWLRSREPV